MIGFTTVESTNPQQNLPYLLTAESTPRLKYIYRPQRSCGQGNIFTPVCHSVHRGGGGFCLSACWDTTPLEQTPPGTRPPPGSRLQHTVYERPVHILLECILVYVLIKKFTRQKIVIRWWQCQTAKISIC